MHRPKGADHKVDVLPGRLLLLHPLLLYPLLEPLGADEGERPPELKDEDPRVDHAPGIILQIAPLPARMGYRATRHVHSTENDSLGRSCITNDEGYGDDHGDSDALEDTTEDGAGEGNKPDDEVAPQTTLGPGFPEGQELPGRGEVYQAFRRRDDDGRESGLREELQHWREAHQTKTDNAGTEDTAELSLHAALVSQARATQRTAGREGAKEGPSNA
mmetsp:Transcript_99149/g.212452  ORF Transcript_99149/g.212452 Transcript_99149/m.212452 type:complete len:217 (+) Transcript_99149:288-938(+)